MKNTRNHPSFFSLLSFFGLLDVISIILINGQIYSIISNHENIPAETTSRLRIVLLILSYLSLFVSAAGFFMHRKFGLITYYFQFPVRLIIWVFSFGFITYLMEYTSDQTMLDWLFRIPIILEFFRLYFTIRIHKENFR